MVCGKGPSIGKKIRQAGRGFDDAVLQPLRPYAQEALTVVGTAIGGPVGGGIGSAVGGLIEGQDPEDALKSGLIQGGIGAFAGPSADFVGPQPQSAGFDFSSLGGRVSQAFGSLGNFLSAPVETVKGAIPSFSELTNFAADKIKSELQRLPENAANAALEMLSGADPRQLSEAVSGGGNLSDILTSIGGGVIANKANKEVLQTLQNQFNTAIQEQRAARDLAIGRTEPFRQAGTAVLPALQAEAGRGPGTTIEQVAPIVNFLRQQGFEDIQESAAARGRLSAGGTLRDLVQFNTDLTSTIIPQLQQQQQSIQQQRFNQLFDVARQGLGAATGQGDVAITGASNISGLRQNLAGGQASSITNRAQDFATTLQNLNRAAGAR